MQASQQRIKVVGLAGTLHAMRKWVAMPSPVPVRFQPIRRRQTPVIRLEPAEADSGERKPAL